jgi:hypothetical protein
MSQVKKVLTATEKATKALTGVSATIMKQMTDLQVSIITNENIQEEVVLAQIKLENITNETDLAVRNQAVDLGLRVREDENKVLDGLLDSRKLAHITKDEAASMAKQIATLTQGNDNELTKAVAVAVAQAQSFANTKLAQANSTHAVETATLKANASALTNEISFLKASIKSLEASAVSEREARVSMAESASKASGVTVNSGK